MNIITLLLAIQLVVLAILFIYLVFKMKRHHKHSPAEQALSVHLEELKSQLDSNQKKGVKKK
jgi:uncharacterized membrane protein YqiK